MKKTKLLEVGFAVCPVGTLRNDPDGDANRATLLSDGRIYNIFNGYSYPVPDGCRRIYEQPQPIRNLVAALISSNATAKPSLRLVHISNQLDNRDAGTVGAQLAANGCDASVLDITRIVLQGTNSLERCTIKYNNSDVKTALAADRAAYETDPNHEVIARAHAPAVLLEAIPKFVEAGFRISGGSFESIRTILLRKGENLASIDVELQWFV
jgi:hypothetical protein